MPCLPHFCGTTLPRPTVPSTHLICHATCHSCLLLNSMSCFFYISHAHPLGKWLCVILLGSPPATHSSHLPCHVLPTPLPSTIPPPTTDTRTPPTPLHATTAPHIDHTTHIVGGWTVWCECQCNKQLAGPITRTDTFGHTHTHFTHVYTRTHTHTHFVCTHTHLYTHFTHVCYTHIPHHTHLFAIAHTGLFGYSDWFSGHYSTRLPHATCLVPHLPPWFCNHTRITPATPTWVGPHTPHSCLCWTADGAQAITTARLHFTLLLWVLGDDGLASTCLYSLLSFARRCARNEASTPLPAVAPHDA